MAGEGFAGCSPDRLAAAVLAVAADPAVGRAVVARGAGALELAGDALGEHLAELDAPLVERVDVPDRALHEHLVLVQRDQRAERFGREPLGHEQVAGAIAREGPVRDELGAYALCRPLLGAAPER